MRLAAHAMIVLASVAGSVVGTSPLTGQLAVDTAALRAQILLIMETERIPGVAVAIVRDDAIWLEGYGVQDLETREPMTAHTRFPIGSATKQFTAAAVMVLTEEGGLSPDDRLDRPVRDVSPAVGSITIDQLLTHRSGLPRDIKRGHSVAGSALLDSLRRVTPAFPPGSRTAYSNTGYILAGMLVEQVAGTSLGAFLEQRIFRPVGMDSTVYFEPSTPRFAMAMGYERRGDELRPLSFFPARYGAGSIVSTAHDMARWLRAIARGTLLSPASRERMWLGMRADPDSPLRDAAGRPFRMGYGWWVTDDDGRLVLSHGGSVDGFLCIVDWHVDERFGIVVLLNNEGSSTNRIAAALANAARDR